MVGCVESDADGCVVGCVELVTWGVDVGSGCGEWMWRVDVESGRGEWTWRVDVESDVECDVDGWVTG